MSMAATLGGVAMMSTTAQVVGRCRQSNSVSCIAAIAEWRDCVESKALTRSEESFIPRSTSQRVHHT